MCLNGRAYGISPRSEKTAYTTQVSRFDLDDFNQPPYRCTIQTKDDWSDIVRVFPTSSGRFLVAYLDKSSKPGFAVACPVPASKGTVLKSAILSDLKVLMPYTSWREKKKKKRHRSLSLPSRVSAPKRAKALVK